MIGAYHYYGTAGDIAIDDVKFDGCAVSAPPSSCSSNQMKCNNGYCIPNSAKCDFEQDCCDGTEESDSVCSSYTR